MMRVDKKRLIQFMDGIVDVTVLVTGKRIFIQIIAAGSLRFGRITVRAREEDYSRDKYSSQKSHGFYLVHVKFIPVWQETTVAFMIDLITYCIILKVSIDQKFNKGNNF